MTEHRCGYVSIVGRPNAGKSTLINRLVGEKVAIVADKPQTTRTIVQGVLTQPGSQIIFLDTPGIHVAGSRMNQRMMESAKAAMEDRDLLLYVVAASREFSEKDESTLEVIRRAKTPSILILNKIDLVEPRAKLLELLAKYQEIGGFEAYVPISATTGEGVDKINDLILPHLPEGAAIFPDDYLTDQPERFLAAELIREKLLHYTEQEIPHAATVWVEEFVDKPHVTTINAVILVEREGQKRIVIGAKGQLLKRIGSDARLDIERLLDRKVYLELFVKVRENWRENAEYLNTLDWRNQITSQQDES